MRKKRGRGPPFVMLERATLNSKEWRELSPPAKVIYIYIKKNYNGGNNGQIPFPYSQVEDEFAPATISKALKELKNKGWIEITRPGGLFRSPCLYKLTGKYDRIR